jgi:hypothetical protein
VLILTLCAAVLGSAINIPFRYGSLQAESLLANYEKLRTAGKVKPDAATSDQRPATSDQRPAKCRQTWPIKHARRIARLGRTKHRAAGYTHSGTVGNPPENSVVELL